MMQPLRVFRGRRRHLLGALVANGLAQAAMAGAALVTLKLAFDTIASAAVPHGRDAVAMLGVLAAVACVMPLLRVRESVLSETLAQDFVQDVRAALFDRMCAMPSRTLQRRSRGAVLLRFVGDIQALRDWAGKGLAKLLVSGVVVAGVLVALACLSPGFAALCAAFLAATVGALGVTGRHMRNAATESRKVTARLAARMDDRISAMPAVQAFGSIAAERLHLDKSQRALAVAMIRRARLRGYAAGLAEFGVSAVTVAVLSVVMLQSNVQAREVGTLAAMLSLAGLLAGPLRDLARVFEYHGGASVSLQKITAFLAVPDVVEEAEAAQPLALSGGSIEFRGVGVTGCLEDVSVTAAAGARIAIVGPNGSGKSTLLQLVARLLDPDAGGVFIDGQPVTAVSLASLRRSVAIVGQDLHLMRGSLGRNLRSGNPRATDEEVMTVLRECGLDGLMATWPRGLRTQVREGGANLTAGQRMRFGLARALLAKPTILLLDDAASGLDPESQAVLGRIIVAFPGTVLFVTHDARQAVIADWIWYLSNGRLAHAARPHEAVAGPIAAFFQSGTPAVREAPSLPPEDSACI